VPVPLLLYLTDTMLNSPSNQLNATEDLVLRALQRCLSNGTKLGRKHLYKVLYKVSSFHYIPPTNMAAKGNSCFWLANVKKIIFIFLFFFFVLKPWATWSALGAKQEGLTIVHLLNKLIVSCKPFHFFFYQKRTYFGHNMTSKFEIY
jgi:hypothetical protein